MPQEVTPRQILICATASAEKIGLKEAIVLQQIAYWQKKCGADEWIYNSYNTWRGQFKYLTRATIRRIFASLIKHGFLEFRRGYRCTFYRLRCEAVSGLLLDTKPTDLCIDAVPRSISSEAQAIQTIEKPVMEDTLQQMLDIWERKIPTSGQALSLTSPRKTRLQRLFTTTFDSNLERWGNFVNQIAKSDFLMGKVTNTKFKVFLDWAIFPENCTKILEGAYTRKGADNKIAEPDKMQENIDSHLELINNTDWKETAKLLIRVLGMPEYQSWIGKARFKKYENNCIYLEAETRFIGDWIDGHYTRKIIRAWVEATNKVASSLVIRPGA